MNIQIKNIDDIKPNPDNPRIIKDDKYKKLVKSIQEFPKMLEIRPIVVDSNNVVLGGNMRLKACKEAGLKEIPVICADTLSPEQQKEFIIKDNVSFGQWDWNTITAKWDSDVLSDWGMDVLTFGNTDIIDEINYENEWVGMPEFTPKTPTYKLIIHFDHETDRQEFVDQKEIEIRTGGSGTWITTYPFKEKTDLTSLEYDI